MAQASEEIIKSDQQSLVEATICFLGNHQLQDPKLLPCQHSFCKECIKKEIRQKEEGKFKCPKCQLELPLDENEVENLKDDYLFQSLQESMLIGKDEVFCVICEFDDKRIPATFQCQDCGETVCCDCKKGHTRTLKTINHKLVPMEEIKEGKHASDYSKKIECQKHSTAEDSLCRECYCNYCKLTVCHLCVLLDHQGHDCSTLEEAWNNKSAKLNDLMTCLLTIPKRCQDILDNYEAALKINKTRKEKHENDIHERATKIIDIVEKIKDDKLKEVHNFHAEVEKSIKSKSEAVKMQSQLVDSLTRHTEMFSKVSTKANFLLQVNELISKAKGKKEEIYKFEEANRLKIGVTNWETMEQNISDNFGTFMVKSRLTDVREIFKVKNGYDYVLSLAVTENDEIIAVGLNQSEIKIYNNEGKPKGTIKCKELKSASHLVVKGKDIYVSDTERNVVLVMDMNGKVKRTIRVPFSGHGNIGLAVDDDGCVYMASHYHQVITKCERHENEAKMFVTQQGNPALYYPLFLCTTPKGELVVSNSKSNTIQIYNKKAELQWQYKGEGEWMLSKPHGVCCDTEGRIYIADCKKRIAVVDDSLQRQVSSVRLDYYENTCGIALDSNNDLVCSFGGFISKLQLWQ